MFVNVLKYIIEVFSCFCRFDKRITAFAEEKFKRGGIDVKTGSMVVNVSDKEISTKELKNGGTITNIPYGMVLWSTGIGTRPVVKDFMKQIGQVCYSSSPESIYCLNVAVYCFIHVLDSL